MVEKRKWDVYLTVVVRSVEAHNASTAEAIVEQAAKGQADLMMRAEINKTCAKLVKPTCYDELSDDMKNLCDEHARKTYGERLAKVEREKAALHLALNTAVVKGSDDATI
jgi:hypothetical protein